MIPAQRHGLILSHLRRLNAASIGDLAELVGVSISTIRRDLEHLEGERLLDRTRGGAVLARTGSMFEPHFEISTHIAESEKTAIGEEAAMRIDAGDSVIFDSSSTVFQAVRAVLARGIPITALTNDIKTASVLAEAPGVTTMVVGGTVRPGSMTLLGAPGIGFLKEIHADLALIGAHSVCNLRLSETSIEAAQVKQAIIRAAQKVILLADSSKFQEPSFSLIAELNVVDEVITDAGLATEKRAEIETAGISLTVVSV